MSKSQSIFYKYFFASTETQISKLPSHYFDFLQATTQWLRRRETTRRATASAAGSRVS